MKQAIETNFEATGLTKRASVRRRIDLSRIGVYAILLLFAVIYLGPMFTVVNVALKTPQEFSLNPTSLAHGLYLKNFTDAWKRANFPVYVTNTFFYTTAATAICVVATMFVAFPIARRYVKGSNLLLTLYVIALFLPPSLIPQFQMMLRLNLYNTQAGYIFLLLVSPVGVIVLVNYMRSIPRDLDEAAAIDGCGYFRFVTQIVFPLCKPALATVTVLHAIGIWNELILPTIYLTNKAFLPITRGLMVFYGQFGNEWWTLAAAVLMLMIPMVVLFLALQRYFIGGALQGSVKG
jgi:raffinose/stachyose/melibiose transport system permease protein